MDSDLLEIRLLGEFALYRGERECPAPTLKKARILVAHLALHPGHPFLRDDLSAHLWPDVEPQTARFNLRQLIARIRRASPDLSPCIVAEDRTTIHLDATTARIDAIEFQRLVRSDPGQAVLLYKGPLLGSMEDSWLEGPRADLEELYMKALELLADRASPRDAVVWLRRAVESDPYREPVQQKLLSKLAECGDLTGMQVAYRQFQEQLHRDLNLSPSEETTQLVQHLLGTRAQSPAQPPPRPVLRSALPVPLTQIVGREAEIAELSAMLRAGRLVTLLGPGGAGKTRLAVAIGAKEQQELTDGVWFADFSSVDDPVRVPQTIGRLLGLLGTAGVPWEEAVAECIGNSDRLLILDNCEHLIEACGDIAEHLLTHCPRLTILATSRAPLGLDGEQRYPVPPLAFPVELGPNEPVDYANFSGLRLFESRARLVSPNFSISASNAPMVLAICREVDALPLGIEMACARLGAFSLDEVARRLDDKLSFLRNPIRTSSPRHKSLGAVIDWSYELLPEDGRTLLRRLAVFSGGWSAGSAEDVCSFGALRPDLVLDAMATLTEASLIQRRGDRYICLETVREFAEQRLKDGTDEDEIRTRHAIYFAESLDDIQAHIAELGPDKAAAKYAPELDNIRKALAYSLQADHPELGLRLVANASLAFSILQLDSEAAEWLHRVLALQPSDLAARVPALLRACQFYRSTHAQLDRTVARENTTAACVELIDLAHKLGDRQALADGLYVLSSVAVSEEAGWSNLVESLEINRSLPAGGHSYRPLRTMGTWFANRGELERAFDLFRQSAQHARQVHDVGHFILALQSESHLLREQCRYGEALERQLEIGQITRDWGDARESAFNDLRLAELNLDRWDFTEMAEPIARAKAFYEQSRSRFHEMLVDGMSRYLAAHQGRIRDALDGLSGVATKLISGATGSNWAWWHAAAIEMEAMAYCLSRAKEPRAGARFLGIAQSLRARDGAFLSPSVRARWSHLINSAGFSSYLGEVSEGALLSPDQILALAAETERELLDRYP